MDYREYEIVAPLRPYVRVIWTMESASDEAEAPPMRILPDSCVELVFHYHVPYQTTFSSGHTSLQPHSMIVAQMKDYIEISPKGRTGMVSIRFSAHGAYHFFGVPMRAIANGITELRLVWSDLGQEIEERVWRCATNADRIRIVQQYLVTQLFKNGLEDKTVDYCIQVIQSTQGLVSVEDLSRRTGISNRQLVRRFNNRIGLPPKEFARIIRFINAVKHLKFNGRNGLTQVALDCGYYDQAHFIRDFKEFSGLTPGEFLTTERHVVL